MEDKIYQVLRDCKVLILIDNLESVLRQDREKTRNFLKQLLERCPFVKILTTTRDLINDLDQITEKVYELKTLDREATISLL
jgi:hypothetical protein